MTKISWGKYKWLWVNLGLMALVALALLCILFAYLGIYTRHGEAIAIPEVKGMNYEDAIKILEDKGLEAIVSDSDYIMTSAPGEVLELTPSENQMVKSGRTVYLTINNLSTPLQEVPDVVDNSSLRQAEARLLASGFKLSASEYVSGEKDWVYGVKYNGRLLGQNEKVPAGATLSLQIGGGEELSDSLSADTLGIGIQSQRVPSAQTRQKSESGESWF